MEEDFQTLKKNFNSLVTFDYKHRMEQLDILQKMLNENKEKVKKNNFLIFFSDFLCFGFRSQTNSYFKME
jgi:hypothetical protein